MFDPTAAHEGLLTPIDTVVSALLKKAPGLAPDRVMLIGAMCRDIMHSALGHEFGTRETYDLDLALGLRSWTHFEEAAKAFTPVSDSGVCFRIEHRDVDLLPFGDVEDPVGSVEPPTRRETLSVWAFEEIHADSLPLALPTAGVIRIPTVPGYVAAKVGAWLDRWERGEYKDATDLAVALHWYAESRAVTERLYDTKEGQQVNIAHDFHGLRAAAHLLGRDVVRTIGPERQQEMLARWPGDQGLLERRLSTDRGTFGAPWPGRPAQATLVAAFTSGLSAIPGS